MTLAICGNIQHYGIVAKADVAYGYLQCVLAAVTTEQKSSDSMFKFGEYARQRVYKRP